ncbi:MAG: rhodanese-like domain-containing protein [Nitrospirota bacterium]|nr:rhodanese-like domain-containing protein [Nitrospirota bacterium]
MDITASFTTVQNLRPDEVRTWLEEKRIGDFTLLDVRQPAEHQNGHIPGSVLIPLPELPNRMSELDKRRPVVAYCRSGNRSRSAASLLADAGMTVFNMEGGMLAWNGQSATGPAEAGLELVRGRTTLVQLASLAWALEEGAARFYSKVLESAVEENVRSLFRSLITAEEGHKQKVLEAYERCGGRERVGAGAAQGPEGLMEGGFSIDQSLDYLRTREHSLRDTLEVSMQIEVNSLDLYLKIIRWSGVPEVKEIFALLVDEEKDHLKRLGSLLEASAI